MLNIELKPCPICGRRPKVKRDYAYESAMFGAWCTIICKPFLRKPHRKIESGKASFQRAYEEAVNAWNEDDGGIR